MRIEYKLHTRHKLPHYQPQDSVFFITFRLAFDLPQTHKNKYNLYKTELEKQTASHPDNPKLKHDNHKRLFALYDNLIDSVPPDIHLTDNEGMYKKLGKNWKATRYSKQEYIENLRRLFAANEYVNIQFEDNRITRTNGS